MSVPEPDAEPDPVAAPAAEPEPLVLPLALPPVPLGEPFGDDPLSVPPLGDPSVPPLEPDVVPLPLLVEPLVVPLGDPLPIVPLVLPPVEPLIPERELVSDSFVPRAALPLVPPTPFFACPGGTPVREAASSLCPGVRPPARDGVLPLAPGERVVLDVSLLIVPLLEPLLLIELLDDMSVDELPALLAPSARPERPSDSAALVITTVVLIMRPPRNVRLMPRE
ncbi:MAG: hypothetical protein ACM3SS_05105 [Rhodospirillaceae bacterium]